MFSDRVLFHVFWFSVGFVMMYFLIVAWLAFIWPLLLPFVHGWL